MGEPGPNSLNYDFHFNLYIAKTLLGNLQSLEDRMNVTRWLHKLALCNNSMEEALLRNDFLYFLCQSIQSSKMTPPFNAPPPSGPLLTHANLLPGSENFGKDECDWLNPKEPQAQPLLFDLSPDRGDFLLSQPLPRCGVFCYMAVLSKVTDDSDDDGDEVCSSEPEQGY